MTTDHKSKKRRGKAMTAKKLATKKKAVKKPAPKPAVKARIGNPIRLACTMAILCFGRKTDELDPTITTRYTPDEALAAADKILADTGNDRAALDALADQLTVE